MAVVWKYGVIHRMQLPRGARVIHVGMQDGTLMLWALVDPYETKEERRLEVIGTGMSVPDGAVHIGSTFDGPFVWHIFEMPA